LCQRRSGRGKACLDPTIDPIQNDLAKNGVALPESYSYPNTYSTGLSEWLMALIPYWLAGQPVTWIYPDWPDFCLKMMDLPLLLG
jgi:hypothetical protein